MMNKSFSTWISRIAIVLVSLLYIWVIFFATVKRGWGAGGVLLLLGLLVGYGLWRMWVWPARRRKQLALLPFPQNWRTILEKWVGYYQDLLPPDRYRFEQQVQYFLHTTRITGVGVAVDDTDRLLVAASAVIPIFAFQDWTYHRLEEVLLYPGAFNAHTYAQEGADRDAAGMVGDGPMSRVVILSKPALRSGFQRQHDGLNTGIHEFTHLLDGADGAFDGVPALAERPYILPWLGVVHREMKRIAAGKSRIRPYGATNKAEFFAVAAEYFFERPEDLQQNYPDLYAALNQFFQPQEVEKK